MKKISKIIIPIIISTFIVITGIMLSGSSYAEEFQPKLKYREFEHKKNPNVPAEGYDLFYNDMIFTHAHLCAWHGRSFFNRKDVKIDIYLNSMGVERNHTYWPHVFPDSPAPPNKDDPYSRLVQHRDRTNYFETASSEWDKPRVEYANIQYFITTGLGNTVPDDHVYQYKKVSHGIKSKDVWQDATLQLTSEEYSGSHVSFLKSVSTDYEYTYDEEGSDSKKATVTTSGRTRYTCTETHYEKNNAMAFLLADCDDNWAPGGMRPANSYVNRNFWAHLNDPPTGTENPYATASDPWAENPNKPKVPITTDELNDTSGVGNDTSGWGGMPSNGPSSSDLSEANLATEAILLDIQAYSNALHEGKKLTNEQCDAIYNAALANLDTNAAAEIRATVERYKQTRDTNIDMNLINKFKAQLIDLIQKMDEIIKSTEESEEPKQNTNDFDKMWKDIGEDYKLKIVDKTNQDAVTVEYDATHQQYIIGPFNIEYIERYTSDYTLASMAGDPVITVKKDGSPMTIARSSGEWDFFYKGPRVTGIPQGYGYDNFPHNGEDFYIKLNYQDGINALMSLQIFFRYMQSEALWTKSEGEIEKMKWSANFGLGTCTQGKCDGGASDIEGKSHNRSYDKPDGDTETGYTHWHVNDSPNGDHTWDSGSYNCNNKTATYICPGHPCGDPECSSDHKHSGPLGCEGYWTCHGHTCGKNTSWGAVKCDHGFWASHWSYFNMFIYGEFIESIPIQYIATCHWAWRMYYEVDFKTTWNIDLTTSLEGDVWLDEVAQKDNSIMEDGTGIKESGEHGVENVLVTIKRYQYNGGDAEYKGDAIIHNTDGSQMSWPQKTDANGHYHVERIEPPAYRNGSTIGSNCFYVAEFQYDGQVYESTIFLRNGSGDDTAQQFMDAQGVGYADRSLAVENATERKDFDAKFTEIFGKDDLSGTTTNGESSGVGNIKYNGKTESQDGVSMIKSEFESAATEDHENMRSGWEGSYSEYNLKSYTYYNGSTEETKANSQEYKIMFPMSDKGVNYGAGDVVYTLNKKRSGNAVGSKRYIDEYMLHINLGLQKRKETDISLLKDLYKMTVVVNEQELVQNYNCLGPQVDENDTITIQYNGSYATLKGKLESERSSRGQNKLGLYESDVQYASGARYKDAAQVVKDIKKNTELRVFATYAIRIYNNSDTNDVEINELIDYYDSTYSVVDDDPKMSKGHIGYDDKDGIHCPIIDEKTGAHSNKLVADKPYYRVLTTKDGADANACIWKPTKQQNLDGMDRQGNVSWSDAGTTGGMKKSTTDSLKGEVLKVNEYIEIFTTYEIDYEGFVTMTGSDTQDKSLRPNIFSKEPEHKNNVAEISNYTTYYSERDDEDPQTKPYYKPYVRKQVSGKIDKDSAPDNVPEGTILDITKYEDDTCRAIPVQIALEKEERQMYGYVFEDKKGDPDTTTGLRMGDGLYKSSTNGAGDVLVPEVKVSMYEVITLGDVNSGSEIKYDDLEYYYEVPQACYNKGAEIITTKDASNDGNYRINGYLAGDYVLRFDYGTRTDATETLYTTNTDGQVVPENNVPIIQYNGQDYENTAFLSGVTYPDAGSAINDKYLNLRKEDMKTAKEEAGIQAIIYKDESKLYSVARDNEARRMVVDAFSRTIENDRGELLRDRRADDPLYSQATAMFAETPIMQIEISDPKNLDTDTRLDTDQGKVVIKTEDTLNITTKEYHINNINFGLEERAKTDIKLEEYIESIILTKNNEIVFGVTLKENGEGKWVVDKTHQSNQHLDKLTYITRYDAGNTQQGFYSISVEDDYLNGMTMKIDYRIKIINDSEVDYTGELARYYRANEILKKTKSSPTTEGYQAKFKEWEEGNAAESSIPVNSDMFDGLASNTVLKELIDLYGTDTAIQKLLGNSTGIGASNLKHDTIRPDTIVYGQYVGRYYYENKVGSAGANYTIKNYRSADMPNIQISYAADNVVRTTVNQLINYVDVNASYDLSTQSYENSAWDLSGTVDKTSTARANIDSLDSLVSEYSYRSVNGESNIYDEKDKALVTDVSSNIVISKNNKIEKIKDFLGSTGSVDSYLGQNKNDRWVEYRKDHKDVGAIDNTNLDVELVPKAYTGDDTDNFETEMWIMTTKTASSDTEASDMSFDNLVEVLVYSNSTGRRDVYSVPGNAMVLATQNTPNTIGFWKAGYNSKDYWLAHGATEPYLETSSKQWATYPEDDAYAPEFVTIIAPTGITLRDYIKNIALPMTILVITMIAMAGIFGVKQIKIHKRGKED